ncbi:MAG: DUF2330 domain-containing protein [Myxococcales bacterium]|nr:DUF2330 domain-containing protein [Myxococcales bacterium]
MIPASRAVKTFFKPAFTAFLLCAALVTPQHADACGGCFNTVPPAAPGQPSNGLAVVQDAERVFFSHNPKSGITRVWVEVRYSGAAEDFGWVLPVPKVPTISVGTSIGLDLIDNATGARFKLNNGGLENCRNPQDGCEPQKTDSFADATAGGAQDMASSSDASSPAPAGEAPTVTVLDQGQSGPYDYTVLKSNSAKALQDWLDTRGYKSPATAKPIIQSHLDKGDVFVAIKLSNGKGVNLIRPIVLEMKDSDPCVPLRLTSIAAAEEMSVRVTLAGPGRAVPKNMLHVEINPALINWLGAGSNYENVIAAAIDEAAGRGFVTEYAGNGSNLANKDYSDKKLDTSGLDGAKNLQDVAVWLYGTGKTWLHKDAAQIFVEKAGIIEPIYKTWGIKDQAKALGQLWVCGAIWSGAAPGAAVGGLDASGGTAGCVLAGASVVNPSKVLSSDAAIARKVDGKALGAALQAEISEPLMQLMGDIAKAPKVTRLAMRIGPLEMDRDPIFDFNSGLPDVKRDHTATLTNVCSTGWLPADQIRITIPTVGSYLMPVSTKSSATDPRFKNAPFARNVQVLDDSGLPIAVAPAQVDLVDTALAGAEIGKASPAKALSLKAPTPWAAPTSDPTVVTLGVWKKPGGCVAKAGWVDGKLPPGSVAPDGGSTATDGTVMDAGSSGGDAVVTDGGATTEPTTPRSDSGCSTSDGAMPLSGLGLLILAALAIIGLRRRADLVQ